jgi:hypothetical protein
MPMPNKYFYQGREVELKGQLGPSIYEIQDPTGKLHRGQIFSVAIAQVEIRTEPDPQPEATIISRKKSSDASTN